MQLSPQQMTFPVHGLIRQAGPTRSLKTRATTKTPNIAQDCEKCKRFAKECAQNPGRFVAPGTMRAWQDFLALVMWAKGPAVRPAQGNALGKGGRLCPPVGPTGQSLVEGLARWADNTSADGPISVGLCPRCYTQVLRPNREAVDYDSPGLLRSSYPGWQNRQTSEP